MVNRRGSGVRSVLDLVGLTREYGLRVVVICMLYLSSFRWKNEGEEIGGCYTTNTYMSTTDRYVVQPYIRPVLWQHSVDKVYGQDSGEASGYKKMHGNCSEVLYKINDEIVTSDEHSRSLEPSLSTVVDVVGDSSTIASKQLLQLESHTTYLPFTQRPTGRATSERCLAQGRPYTPASCRAHGHHFVRRRWADACAIRRTTLV